MDNRNETASRHCCFLSAAHFPKLYETFIEAFSDYVFPFALTEDQFRNHIILNAVDLERTMACMENGKLVGFSLNGFGEWDGKPTVYDAGTGVIPAFRRQGLSDAMFAMMMPFFKEKGIEQFLLEVVTSNYGAIRLYEKLDFRVVRELALLQCDGGIKSSLPQARDIEIRDILDCDWELFTSFWDGKPSWQNSVEAVGRTTGLKKIAGAFIAGRCVGYIVFSSKFGRIAQMAVDRSHRNRGVGTMLLQKTQSETATGYSLQVINIDKSLSAATDFFRNRGFYERLSQFEMIKPM
ncbi:MAG: GNAT family N-acetyltransferase [Pyrinomonadaceae bacterium]